MDYIDCKKQNGKLLIEVTKPDNCRDCLFLCNDEWAECLGYCNISGTKLENDNYEKLSNDCPLLKR